jgi:hypothetical protein
VEEQVSGMPQQVLPIGHDLVGELLGEKAIANLMESWCFELKIISFILSNDVKELVRSSTQHGQQVSPPHDDLTLIQQWGKICDAYLTLFWNMLVIFAKILNWGWRESLNIMKPWEQE